MIRIVPFSFGGSEFQLASMSWKQAELYTLKGREWMNRMKENPEAVSDDEWKARMFEVIVNSLNKAAGSSDCTRELLEEQYDKPTLEAVYRKVLEVSGLIAADTGEAPAA